MAKKVRSASSPGGSRGKKTDSKRKSPSSKTASSGSPSADSSGQAKPKSPSRSRPAAAQPSANGTRGRREKKGYVYVDHSSEDLFANQILEELEFRHGIDTATLDVRIRDGVAVARGWVSDMDELEAVRETVQDAGGITDMTFVVQVSPDRREMDRDRARQIQECLDADPGLGVEGILVACVGRKAIVRGTVSSPLKKAAAGVMTLRSGDVARVANRLVVLSSL